MICERCERRRAVWSLYAEDSIYLCGPCVLPYARWLITEDRTDLRLLLDLLDHEEIDT